MSSLYQCCDCSGAFHSLDELQKHQKKEHEQDENKVGEKNDENALIKIKIEDFDWFSDTDSAHQFMNPKSDKSVSGEFKCKNCHQMFVFIKELETHTKIPCGKQLHSCIQCGKEFRARHLLNAHLKWHAETRSHVCLQCNKAFLNKGHLNQHLKIHIGARPHECPECHITYMFRFDLNRHMKKCHQESVFSCQQCGKSFLKQFMLDKHYLKCKGKPSVLEVLPTIKAASRSAFTVKPSSETLVLLPETIAKMTQIQLIQPQENRKSALNTYLVDNILNHINDSHIVNESYKNGGIDGFEVPAPAMPPNLTCMLCKIQFNNQYSFALHMYTYHLANQNTNLSHHQATSIGNQNVPNPIGSDSDTATDTSCASDSQNTSLFPLLESPCLRQNSVSPSSFSEASSQLMTSESSSTMYSCKDCTSRLQRVHDLEQLMLKKDGEFENYRQMTRQIIFNISNFLTTSATPENMFMANVLTHLENIL